MGGRYRGPATRGVVGALVLALALPALSACQGSSGSSLEPPAEAPLPPESPAPPDPPATPPPAPPAPPVPPPPAPPPPPGPPPPGSPPDLGDDARLLFIGNSLTSGNYLPDVVEALARADGLGWEVDAVTIGGRSLEDHWQIGTARQRLSAERWDFVVLQQGPSSLPQSRVNLRHWTAEFDQPIRAAGGRSALYMVWPYSNRQGDFNRVRDSYALAAADVNGRFLPAGETWREAWRRDPATALYGPDGFHPAVAGTYAAALTIYAGLTGRSVVGLPAELSWSHGGSLVSVPPALALLLQESADRTVAAFRDYRPADAP